MTAIGGKVAMFVCVALAAVVGMSSGALAVTTVDTYEGSNVVQSDSSCGSWVIPPQSPQYTYHHVNGDSVAFPMYNKYLDQRPSGSPLRTLASGIQTSYGGTGYIWGGLHYHSTGNAWGYQFGTFNPGFPVYVYTSLDVIYSAYVYDASLNILCYAELTVTFNFIP